RVLLTGEAADRPLAEAVAAAMEREAEVLCGRTTLGSLALVLSKSRLLVTNDTGVSHIAAALRVPSVVLFLHSDPERWAPLDRERHLVLVGETAVQNSCLHDLGGHRCLADGCRFGGGTTGGRPILPDEVVRAALSLLDARGAHARA
ncbi:MAG TPA: glycosyltransferase family 9 protein, partial [Dehalococcoidia bacterium]|nr:glycosyltransferase family 9 protein [Dehalococcoidia bacterium]